MEAGFLLTSPRVAPQHPHGRGAEHTLLRGSARGSVASRPCGAAGLCIWGAPPPAPSIYSWAWSSLCPSLCAARVQACWGEAVRCPQVPSSCGNPTLHAPHSVSAPDTPHPSSLAWAQRSPPRHSPASLCCSGRRKAASVGSGLRPSSDPPLLAVALDLRHVHCVLSPLLFPEGSLAPDPPDPTPSLPPPMPPTPTCLLPPAPPACLLPTPGAARLLGTPLRAQPCPENRVPDLGRGRLGTAVPPTRLPAGRCAAA